MWAGQRHRWPSDAGTHAGARRAGVLQAARVARLAQTSTFVLDGQYPKLPGRSGQSIPRRPSRLGSAHRACVEPVAKDVSLYPIAVTYREANDPLADRKDNRLGAVMQ